MARIELATYAFAFTFRSSRTGKARLYLYPLGIPLSVVRALSRHGLGLRSY